MMAVKSCLADFWRMSINGRLIGPHLQLGNGLLRAADRARQIGATAVQIFSDNPTAWRRRTTPPKDLPEFRARLTAAGINSIAIHAPYLVNLCGSNSDFWARSVQTMAHELVAGREYGAQFVVMHIGSHRGDERTKGIERLVSGLAAVLAEADRTIASDGADRFGKGALPRLVLENAAGMGDGIGSSIEDLADILSAADSANIPLARLGVCLDTAHLWGAGYDVGSGRWIDLLAERSERVLGRDNLVMLHLNDSRTELGSRLDRHEHIGAGRMGHDGLRELLNHPWLGSLPTLLETPGMDAGYDATNLERALLLADGQELPDLPAEAFKLRRGASRSGPPDA
jgi:deoxyribonuclease-4